ncbi:MAG: AI-2E family transporter, partial [bacterium]|nr:AI-2E family transporter [bacterium]
METRNFNITWGGLWKIFFMLMLVWALFLSIDIVLALFIAVVISSAMDPVVTWLESKKIPRILGTLAIYIAALFLFALLIYLILPIALNEFSNLIANFDQKLAQSGWEFLNLSRGVEVVNQALNNISNLLLGGSRSFFDITSKFFGGLALTGSVFVLSFYLTVGKDGTEKFLLTILPPAYENRAIELYNRIRRKIGRWLRGQLLLSLGIGILVFLALEILGVKYSLV